MNRAGPAKLCVSLAWLCVAIMARGADPVTIQSRSGQFHVHGLPVGSAPPPPSPALTNLANIRLDPALLAVSCEEIKRQLLRTLEAPDEWSYPISLRILAEAAPEQPIDVEAVKYTDGWRYRVQIPLITQRARLVRTMVELLLLEMAQRYGAEGAVDLPPWLGPGLSAKIQADGLGNLTLEPYSLMVARPRHADPLEEVRSHLQTHPPLTLEELSWPLPPEEGGPLTLTFDHCSHLLVHELLRLRGGAESMQRMLRLLPEHLNWQAAFLRAYRDHFPRIMEFDKWWSLNLVHVAGRDISHTWSAKESWKKLDEILTTPVQVRTRRDELPMTTQASLQSIVQEWEFRRQLPLLRMKLNHLAALRLRAAPEAVQLVDDYRQALENYVQRRSSLIERTLGKGSALLVEETVSQLDELDAQVDQLKRLLSSLAHPRNSPPAPR